MKKISGIISAWDNDARTGTVRGDDGKSYPFTIAVWRDTEAPATGNSVQGTCANGRDISELEYVPIEHMPMLRMQVRSQDGVVIADETKRFIGGPWRMLSDSYAWLMAAEVIHHQSVQLPMTDLIRLLKGTHTAISIRGSVVKYCYGMAIELYFKWILTEAQIKFPERHELWNLYRRLPVKVQNALTTLYARFFATGPKFVIKEAGKNGVVERELDWSTLRHFLQHIDSLKFIVGRYATPNLYSIIPTNISSTLHVMNTYMDSDAFFVIANHITSYLPKPDDYR